MQIQWQHIFGFGGTLILLTFLINEKLSFLADAHSYSAAIDATRCSNANSHHLGIR
jgi:hypothetical protein